MSTPTHYTALVIGAGIAGLKACNELHANGIDSVICIESRDRIGGRLHAEQGRNGKYEVGAAWHHDTLSNGLFLEELSLPAEERADFVFDDEDATCLVDKNSGIVNVDQLDTLRHEFERWVEMKYYQSLGVKDLPYFDLCIEFCYQKRDLLTNDQLFHLPQLLRYMELWHGVDWYGLSGKFSGIEHNGRNALVFSYDKIVSRIAKPIKDKIHLNESVSLVKKLPNGGFQVQSDKGNYTCDYCIVTVPQSVLTFSCKDPEPSAMAAARIQFDPPLNSAITEALTEKSSFGSLGKVIFEFDKVKWSTKCGRFLTAHEQPQDFVETVRNSDDLHHLLSTMREKLPRSNDDSWKNPTYIVNLAKRTGIPTFVALTQQPLTEYLETLSKEEVEQFYRPVINKLLHSLDAQDYICDLQDKIPDSDSESPVLKNIITTKWSSDPFALGAYSACKPGDDPMDLVIALSAGQGNLRFAGEHTIMDGAGCAYGAWESGKREAKYILDKVFTR